mmetsp:Transcript_6600/g.22755  ORF Transcript_6600/g.22755 Transcript_6600/m.22755 type:complete len:220 (+) Transcript_6600:528-1187(+)
MVMISGTRMPTTPTMAHLACWSSACWNQTRSSGSDPRERGSNPKSPASSPLRCSGASPPGYHNGLFSLPLFMRLISLHLYPLHSAGGFPSSTYLATGAAASSSTTAIALPPSCFAASHSSALSQLPSADPPFEASHSSALSHLPSFSALTKVAGLCLLDCRPRSRPCALLALALLPDARALLALNTTGPGILAARRQALRFAITNTNKVDPRAVDGVRS